MRNARRHRTTGPSAARPRLGRILHRSMYREPGTFAYVSGGYWSGMRREMAEPARMAPSQRVSRRFSRLPRSSTAPESALRRALHGRGRRFRVQYPVPGAARRSVDIAFTRVHLAVFVDGCFWHGCPHHRKPPARNPEWWEWKVNTNRARDGDTDDRLLSLGWAVVRVWEHTPTGLAADSVDLALVLLRSGQVSTGAVGAPGKCQSDVSP